MKTPTPTIIKALEVLAHDVQSEDGVANACLHEAAARMREMHDEIERLREIVNKLPKTKESAKQAKKGNKNEVQN